MFAGLHVWTADAASPEDRGAWSKKLSDNAALRPAIVVPGHSAPGQPQDLAQVAFTQAYLQRWDAELKNADDSLALIKAMKAAYPTAGLDIAVDIGAKVGKGEMKW